MENFFFRTVNNLSFVCLIKSDNNGNTYQKH